MATYVNASTVFVHGWLALHGVSSPQHAKSAQQMVLHSCAPGADTRQSGLQGLVPKTPDPALDAAARAAEAAKRALDAQITADNLRYAACLGLCNKILIATTQRKSRADSLNPSPLP